MKRGTLLYCQPTSAVSPLPYSLEIEQTWLGFAKSHMREIAALCWTRITRETVMDLMFCLYWTLARFCGYRATLAALTNVGEAARPNA